MKIVAFEVEDWERKSFEGLETSHEVLFTEKGINDKLPAGFRDADIISVFIYSELNAETLARFPDLKFVVTRSTGYNHIDLDYCRHKNIAVSNDPDYGPSTVAEHVFALIHAISRHIPEAVERTRRSDFSMKGLRGFDLRGKTIGVIGTGDIGINVIRIARGYDMDVVAFDVRPNQETAMRLGFRYLDMDMLLAVSDIMTLHVPGNDKTRNMIDTPQFDRMKKGVVIINTARGSVVNAQALLKALHEGKVGGAGLDVLNSDSVVREEAELLRSVFTRNGDCPNLLMDMLLADMRMSS
jgi:D-lactate dehydrogenase